MTSRRLVVAVSFSIGLVLAIGIVLPGPANAQLPKPPSTPKPIPGPPGSPMPSSECALLGNQPTITFTLTGPSDGTYPGDSVTIRWDVRHRSGRPWDHDLYVRTDPPEMRGSVGIPERLREISGSHTFGGSRRTPSVIRLETRCGSQEVRYTPVPAPHLDDLSPVKVGIGERIRLRGRDFGSAGEVQRVLGETRTTMPVHSWTNTDIEVSVPSGAPVGSGYIHLFKGRGRLQSNSRAIRIVKVLTINRGFLQSLHDMLHLSRIQVHLDRTESFVRFPTELRRGGVTDRSFTLPSLEAAVPTDRSRPEINPRLIRYSVNDINSNNTDLSVAGGQLVIRIGFDSGGPEIKGEQYFPLALGRGGFATRGGWDDESVPDGEVDNATMTFRLTPVVRDGILDFSSPPGAFSADFRLHAWPEDWPTREFADYERRLKSAINVELNNAFGALRSAISAAVMEQLRMEPLRGSRVVAVVPSGDNVRVEYE